MSKLVVRRACSSQYRLSQASLLGLLPSDIDPTHVIEVSTGNTLSIVGVPANVVTANVNRGVWRRIEQSNPRKWLLETKERWTVVSFDPSTSTACIHYTTPQNELRVFSFNLPKFRNNND